MQTYKIQLLSHTPKLSGPEYLWVSKDNLEERLARFKSTSSEHIPYTSILHDRKEDLDLMLATVWFHRLTKLGVKCTIVEVNYSQEHV